MLISLIVAHPYKDSFNAALAGAVADALKGNGHTVRFHDLYQEGFDPILPGEELVSDATQDSLVAVHQEEIREADGIVIVHPNWWGQPPALMKGWVDRVLREGVAYAFPQGDSGGGFPIGLLKARAALVFNTSNTPVERERAVFGDPLQHIWKDCVFAFCGVRVCDRRMFGGVADSTPEERAAWLEEARDLAARSFPRVAS